MTDTTTSETPRRARRPARSRRPLPLRQRRRRSYTSRQRIRQPEFLVRALNELVEYGDVFEAGGQRYLVAPVDDGLIEDITAALAAIEDDEPNGDLEPSLGYVSPNAAIDAEHDDAECGEPSLGWNNPVVSKIGSEVFVRGNQLQLDLGGDDSDRESDGDCDAELSGDERDYSFGL